MSDAHGHVPQRRPPSTRSVPRCRASCCSALRVLLVVFVGITLLLEPPTPSRVCLRPGCLRGGRDAVVHRGAADGVAVRHQRESHAAALLMLGADLTVVASLSVLTGLASPMSWTSDVLSTAVFLIPLIAAAQLDPYVSGVIAVPTLATHLAVAWINQSANEEPWGPILLRLLGWPAWLAVLRVLSRIQRGKVEAIEVLAGQRRQLPRRAAQPRKSRSAKRFRNGCMTAPCNT